MRLPSIALVVATATLQGACARSEPASAPAAAWAPPPESAIPADSFGASVRRGLALLRFTPESLPQYAQSNLRCTSCHQEDGRKATAAPLVTTHARFPRYLSRTGAVVTVQDRVNYCFTRSLAGNALPPGSREMSDIVAYLAFLAKGAPVGEDLPGAAGIPAMAERLSGDSARGAELFTTTCTVCHGKDGAGVGPGFPALWGPRSFSIGASMARQERAAAFIYRNMPQDKPGSLTPQQAFDLAAFVTSHPRPDSPGKDADYPGGDAPPDVPYPTAGHAAFKPPKLLPRQNPKGAVVPAPPSARRGAQ
jgi:thiosulfate dehydrogenase